MELTAGQVFSVDVPLLWQDCQRALRGAAKSKLRPVYMFPLSMLCTSPCVGLWMSCCQEGSAEAEGCAKEVQWDLCCQRCYSREMN